MRFAPTVPATHAAIFKGAPCTDPAHGFIWDPGSEGESTAAVRRRHRQAQWLCVTACPVVAACAAYAADVKASGIPPQGVWAGTCKGGRGA